ncbi:lactococcin G-beta family bacteriocin [Lactococcus lactis]|uniref:lactococcin G-beta family bacteriocin n=1 Tax=Lactococcus lactis TaxID=1358 RepID=UPI0026593489|nr:lactococcin G-beta family bacteriocin [Lactococcus lactis]WKG35027.1 lactococcin G-beta/enterocin 1071B family bacteriocin [Lactococcus lactis subsp. lactis]
MKNNNNNNFFKDMEIIEDQELVSITGGKKWGWLAWVEPAGEFLKGFGKGAIKEGNKDKWKNI